MNIFKGRMGVLVIILVVLIVMLGVNGLPGTTYRSQWEISTEVVAFNVEGATASPVTNPPPTPLGDGDWTFDRSHYGYTVYKIDPSSSVEWDFDHPDYGMPNVRASAGDIRVQDTSAYGNLSKLAGSYKLLIEYREYIFPVQIRTIAGVKMELVTGILGNSAKTWLTETAMPYEWRDNFGQGGTRIGQPIKGSVYVRIATLPYGIPDFGPAPTGYTFDTYWVGILNVKVQSSDSGIASYNKGQPIEEVHKGWVRDIASDGQPLSMSTDDGTFAKPYNPVNWATENVLDPDIMSTIICEVPFDLKAGAYDTYNGWANLGGGQIEEVDPVDHYVTYTVRLECFVVKQYKDSRDPNIPLNPSDIKPPHDWVGTTTLSFWDNYGLWIILGLIFFVIVIIILTWLGLPLMFLVMGSGR